MQTNCGNCGAALSLDLHQDHLQCQYCETVHVLSFREDAHFKRMADIESNTVCPVCFATLSHSCVDQLRLLYCFDCKGILINGETLPKLMLFFRQFASEPYWKPEPIKPRDLARKISCPNCKITMTAHPYYGPGSFVIDSCSTCAHVWLDRSDFAKAVRTEWSGAHWK